MSFDKLFNKFSTKAAETHRRIATTEPFPRPNQDAYEIIMRHEMYKRKYFETINGKSETATPTLVNQLTGPSHCSLRPLDQLTPIRLKDMFVNKRHMGSYLRCRIGSDPYQMTGFSTIVADEEYEIERLTIFNYAPSFHVDPAEFLPENTVIAIKEPYLKIKDDDHTLYHIYVESPTDIVVLDDQDHDVDEWKTKQLSNRTSDECNHQGNKYFVAKECRKAIKEYTQSLKVSQLLNVF